MTYLFVFAHPDDETVACAGTIKQLTSQGETVHIVSATAGAAGEVMEAAKEKVKLKGSLSAVRQDEYRAVGKHLGVASEKILEFEDGEITNKIVWTKLQDDIVEEINTLKPDVVITFDHTGWYYHLDHVGVSIATTLAYQESEHRPQALLFSHFQPGGTKWRYVFRPAPATHQVKVQDKDHKLTTLDLHQSQDLTRPRDFITENNDHYELYELAMADERGKKLFNKHKLFQKIEG